MDVSMRTKYADYERAVVLNRICLKLLGIWPDSDETKEEKFMSDIWVLFIFTTITCSCIIPTIHSLVRIWNDFLSMLDNLQYTLPLLMAVLKAFVVWRNKKELVPILRMIKEDWLMFKTEKERAVMINRARITRIITICGYLILLFAAIFVVILPFFGVPLRHITNATDPGKLMPLQTYYIYDINKSPFYEITFILQFVSLISVAAMYTSTDSFLVLLVLHVCGQLENLSARFLRLDVKDFESSLAYNVRDHRRLIRSIKIIDDTFTVMLLGLLVYFVLHFALHGFLFIATITHDYDFSFGRVIIITVTFVNTFTHTCLYCVVGEILVIQYEGFYKAACEYEWYKLEPRKARNLLIIMIHANKPLYLTAGKFFPMTMATFCSLLKTSGGYISFLLAHRE